MIETVVETEMPMVSADEVAIEVLDEHIEYHRERLDTACRNQDHGLFHKHIKALAHLKIVRRMLTGEEYENGSPCESAPDQA